MYIVYLLHHPESDHMYIGKSTRGFRRVEEHFHSSHLKKYAHLLRSKWIVSLQKRGLQAEVVVLEECATPEELDASERFHISYFRFIGFKLLNLTDGGDGVLGHEFTPEAIAKMSESRQRRVQEIPGERERLVTLSDEYWSTPAARETKRRERLGQKWSPEVRAKMSAAQKGKPKSAEHRAKISAAAKLRCADPTYRQKQSEAQKIAQNRPDVRAKKSAIATQNAMRKKDDLQ